MLYKFFVKRGAALLDKRVPKWTNKLNPDDVDMSNPDYCVLGLVYRSYEYGLDRLNIKGNGWTHGFNILLGNRRREVTKYAKLDELWRAQIEQRQP